MAKFERPPASDHAAHYRLSTATWEMILKEYREGATARFLSKKWRVSMHAIRKRITQHGATKRDWGDEQAIEQAEAREAELEDARRNTPEALAVRLFDGLESCDQSGDPAELARTATHVSGRAMRSRLWNEAKALAGLAESYSRLPEKSTRGSGGSIETVDLQLLFEIVTDRENRVDRRFAVSRSDKDDPDISTKMAYWEHQGQRYADARQRQIENLWRAAAAEKKLGELGVARPTPTQGMIEAGIEAAKWATLTDDDIRRFIAMRANDGVLSPDEPR